MPVYKFGPQYSFIPAPRAVGGGLEPIPQLDKAHGLKQLADVQGGRTPIDWEKDRAATTDIEEFIIPGFHYLDEGMKLFFSDIRVPTKDSYRFIRTRIAGANKSLLIWTDDLAHGRIKLPIMSISRGSHEYWPEMYSPPLRPIRINYVNSMKTMAEKVYRPVPYLVDYTMSIWSETKRDAEHAVYQIISRFNPLAVFKADDGHIHGNVVLRFGGFNDASDKDVPADQLAKIKYEVTCKAEAWLSLPTELCPTIIGRVVSVDGGTEVIKQGVV
jgi:hypothetical protein